MGVDRGPACGVVLSLGQEAAQVLAVTGIFLPVFIEYLEDALRSPTPPPCQRCLFGVRGGSSLVLERVKYLEGFKVRPDAATGSGGGQVFLGGRTEAVRCAGYSCRRSSSASAIEFRYCCSSGFTFSSSSSVSGGESSSWLTISSA